MSRESLAGLGAAIALTAIAARSTAGDAAAKAPSASYRKATDEFYLGGQPSPGELELLKTAGIKAVINLREPDEHDSAAEEAQVKELDLRYVNLPVNPAEPRPEQVEAFRRLIADPANRPALVHCTSAQRVGSFWLIHRVLDDGLGQKEAEAEAAALGLQHPGLLKFARGYIAAHPPKPR